MADILIRDALEGDREAIQSVTLSAIEQYKESLGKNWVHYQEKTLKTLQSPKPAELIVAEIDNKIVGSILLYPAGAECFKIQDKFFIPDHPYIRLLSVVPSSRGLGVGSALVKECVRRARLTGSRAIILHTTEIMKVALGMYERMGFVRKPSLDFKTPTGDDVIKGYQLDL